MALKSELPKTTQYSPIGDGLPLAPWKSERAFSATRPCEHCGATMRPWIGKTGKVQAEVDWNERRFCSVSCAKKQENPMVKENARLKMSETLRKIGHKPPIQGGNGKPFPEAQLALIGGLGEGWVPEFAVPTKIPKGMGYPTCYKIDIANPRLMIGIEVDGASHSSRTNRERDQKKTALLATFGWKIFRITNKQVKSLSTISGFQDILPILQEAS